MADAGGLITVTHPTYGAISIPAADLSRYQDKGYRPESPEEAQGRQDEAFYGDHPILAGFAGLADTVTLGGSSVLARAIGNEGELRGLKEHNEAAYIGGEIVGALVPFGGAGIAGKAGRAAGEIVRGGRALSEASVLARSIGSAARFGAEGGVLGLGQGASAVALADKPITGELIATELSSHFLYGMGAGAGIGVAGELAGVALRASRDATRRMASSFAERAKPPVRPAGPVPNAGDELLDLLTKKPAASMDPDVAAALKNEASTLRTAADVERAKAAAATTDELGGVAGHATGTGDVAMYQSRLSETTKRFRAELGAVESKASQARHRFDDMVADKSTMTEQLKEAGVAVDELKAAHADWMQHFPGKVEQLEQLGAKGKPLAKTKRSYKLELDDATLQDRIEKDPAALAAHRRLKEATVKANEALDPHRINDVVGPPRPFVDQFGEATDDMASLMARRGEIEAKVLEAAKPVTSEALRAIETRLDDVERMIESGAKDEGLKLMREQVAAAEANGLKLTSEQLAEVAQASGLPIDKVVPGSPLEVTLKAKTYQRIAKAERAAREAKIPAPPANGGAAGGAGVAGIDGMVVDSLLDGALGFLLGGLPGTLGSLGGKVARKSLSGSKAQLFGLAAKVTSKISDGLDAVLKAGAKVKSGPGATAATILNGVSYSPDADPDKHAKTAAEAYTMRATEIRGALANREATQRQVHARLEGIRAIDLRLADQLEGLAMRKLDVLGAHLPPPMPVGSLYRGGSDRYRPADADVMKLARAVQAAEQPIDALLDGLASARLSPTTVAVVAAVSPEILAHVQGEVATRLGGLVKDVPYVTRLALSTLFGVGVDSTVRPQFIAAMQANYAAPENGPMDMSKGAIGSVKKDKGDKDGPTTGQDLAAG